jgi:hypothetical protein
MNNPIRKSNLVFNRLKDEVIILDFSSEKQFHQLNDVGARIWELCDGTNNYQQIEQVLCDEFDIDSNEASRDLRAFIDELQQLQLLDC